MRTFRSIFSLLLAAGVSLASPALGRAQGLPARRGTSAIVAVAAQPVQATLTGATGPEELRPSPTPAPLAPVPGIDPALERVLREPIVQERFPNAGVEVIFHDEQVVVNADGSSKRVIREAYRILNRRGQDDYSEVSQDYQPDSDQVTVDFAHTITPDGALVPVQANAVKDASPYADYPAYDRVKVRTFTFPATEPGAIVDYQLTVKSTKPMMDHDFGDEFLLHGTQPIRRLSYTISVPRGRALHARLLHPGKVAITSSKRVEGDRTVYRWQADDLHALPVEPDMPAWGDLLPRLMVTTTDGWDQVASWWRRLIKGKADPDAAIRAQVAQLVKGKHTNLEKAQALYEYVVSHIRYVYVDLESAGFEPQSASNVLTNRYGDCKGGSTLLIAMLHAAGIPAHYALLRTNDKSALVEDSPSPYQFNHCIVAAELTRGHFTFLDNVGKTTPFGVVPDMDQGCRALVFQPAHATFVTVPTAPPAANETRTQRLVEVQPDGGVTVTETTTFTGADDDHMRAFYLARTPAQIRESFEEDAAADAVSSRLIGYRLSNAQDLETPIQSTVTYRAEEYGLHAGDIMMLRIPGFQAGMTEVERTSRTWPLERHVLSREVEEADLVLPRGYRVRYLPPDKELRSPMVSFAASYRQHGDRIRFRAVTEFHHTGATTEQYGQVRELFQQRARYAKEMIVLEQDRR